VKAGSDLVELSSIRRRGPRGSQWEACELGLGTRVRCTDGVVLIERIRLEPISATVTVFADGDEITFAWREMVDVVEV
jgi:hypothetical protein